MSKDEAQVYSGNDVPYDVLLDSPIQFRLNILTAFSNEYQKSSDSVNPKLGITQLSIAMNRIYEEWEKKKENSLIEALSNFANSKEPFAGKPELNNYSKINPNLTNYDQIHLTDDMKKFVSTFQ